VTRKADYGHSTKVVNAHTAVPAWQICRTGWKSAHARAPVSGDGGRTPSFLLL